MTSLVETICLELAVARCRSRPPRAAPPRSCRICLVVPLVTAIDQAAVRPSFAIVARWKLATPLPWRWVFGLPSLVGSGRRWVADSI
ncbi:hypothetical protein ACLOJK_001618 [Asimina triloba]